MAVDSEIVPPARVRSVDRTSAPARAWADEAIRRVEADANRSADTHLLCSDRWLAEQGRDLTPYGETLDHFRRTGRWCQP